MGGIGSARDALGLRFLDDGLNGRTTFGRNLAGKGRVGGLVLRSIVHVIQLHAGARTGLVPDAYLAPALPHLSRSCTLSVISLASPHDSRPA
jgi:hypothetical protein